MELCQNLSHLQIFYTDQKFSEVWPRQILYLGKQFNLMMSSKRLEDIFTRRLEDVLKTDWTCLEDIFARRLADVLKMSWWCFYKSLEDVLKTSSEEHDYSEYIRLDQDVLKTSWRLLQDIFWRRRQKTNVCRLKMLDVDNLAPAYVDLKKLSDVVDNDVAEKTVYNELVKKVNSSQTTDTSDSIKKKEKHKD